MTEIQATWVQKIHKLNDFLHQEPIAMLAYGFYWYLLLLISCPLLACASILHTAYDVLSFYMKWTREILPKDYPDRELAVVITGCDSGFGQELVFSLVSKGFTVFAACLQEESFQHFQGEPKILPLQMNITREEDVEKAADVVSKWLAKNDETSGTVRRHLHALVNNAGTGKVGLQDWLTVKDFQSVMDINFFGTLRVIKAFLPIMKQQSANGTYHDARIVNMSSAAGLIAGGMLSPAYEASKHALDAYTVNLRLELQQWGIAVTTVNPSFHKTPLSQGILADSKQVWNGLSPEIRDEYGEDYFKAFTLLMERGGGRLHWDKKYVVEAMDHAVVAGSPPERLLVGMDAKYIIYPLSKLPTWCRFNFIRAKPAMMTKTTKA